MVRLNCHSAFKHYEMFHHSYGDVINIGSNNTTIFNMGTGFGGGSFWSGLGYGLGNGIGSIFGGLFGGGMGGFGNYGGYGMSPFGMGGFSPFGNMGTWWNSMSTGGGARSGKSADSDGTCHCKDKASNDKSCNDPDLKKINGFRDAVQGIQDLDSPDKAKVKTKYDEIVKAKKDQDDTHKAENTAAYDNLLEDLQKIADKNGWGKLDDKDFGIDKPATTSETKVDGNGKKDDVTPTDGTTNTGKVDRTDTTGNVPTDWSALSEKLNANDIKTLNDIGVTPKTIGDNKQALSLPSSLTVDALNKLKSISDKTGIPVAVARNNGANKIDSWIAGALKDIVENNGLIGFNVDCKNVGAYNLTYSVKQNDDKNTYTISYHSGKENTTEKLYTKPQSDYEFKKGSLEKNGESVVTNESIAKNKKGYVEIK